MTDWDPHHTPSPKKNRQGQSPTRLRPGHVRPPPRPQRPLPAGVRGARCGTRTRLGFLGWWWCVRVRWGKGRKITTSSSPNQSIDRSKITPATQRNATSRADGVRARGGEQGRFLPDHAQRGWGFVRGHQPGGQLRHGACDVPRACGSISDPGQRLLRACERVMCRERAFGGRFPIRRTPYTPPARIIHIPPPVL